MPELGERDLDVALAELQGWQKHVHFEGGTYSWHRPDCASPACLPAPDDARPAGSPLDMNQIPTWHASLDALIRDVLPHLTHTGQDAVRDAIYEQSMCCWNVEDMATAGCRAALKALKEATDE